MTSGRLNTMVSSDTSFLVSHIWGYLHDAKLNLQDWAFPASIELPTAPILILAGMGLLVYTLGVSALVGLGILLGVAPFQGWLFGKLMAYRGTQEKIVDQRVRLLTEIINNIRAVKLYAYETFFGHKVTELRSQELAKLKGFGLMHALINSTFYFLPILAAVCKFAGSSVFT
jgi:ATP-binding cassette subfamily C (CFTR/MRP) protein 1